MSAFKLAPDFGNDVGIIALVNPINSSLSSSEQITVTIRNFGSNTQTSIPVSYSVDGGTVVTETFNGVLEGTSSVNFTFSVPANLGNVGQSYEISAATNLPSDEDNDNDSFTTQVKNLYPNDVGVTSIDAPSTGLTLTANEDVTVTIENFGGEAQSNVPVSYSIGNNSPVNEVYNGTIPVGQNVVYTFSQTANLSSFGRYMIKAQTNLAADNNKQNDGTSKSVANLNCIPTGSDCSLGDGISYFELGDILNKRIPCGDGYIDYIGFQQIWIDQSLDLLLL